MALNQQQLQMANLIYGLGVSRGLSDEHARELVAAAYAESGLNPGAVNKSSGAGGLFQLLSGGYRSTAQRLGGINNPRANTLAILPSYQRYFAQHPNALPGEAGRDVELSGKGSDFYSGPLRLLSGLLHSGSGGVPSSTLPGPVTASMPSVVGGPPANLAYVQSLLSSLRSTREGQPLNVLPVVQALKAERAAQPLVSNATPALAPVNHGQRRTTAGTPLHFTKIVGLPFQGTHGVDFNTRGGSNNWESENAVDLAAPVGTPVYAVASGTIGSQIGAQGGGRFAGLRLHLDSASDEFFYGHLSKLVVKAGQRVKAGQLLGYSGSANGVGHLHFASREGDPRSFLSK